MPNWATGTLKIRGSKDEILRFSKDILSQLAGDKERTVRWRLWEEDDGVEFDDNTLIATVYDEPRLCIWLEDSNRHFIDMDLDVPYYWDMSRKQTDGSDRHEEYRTVFNLYNLPKNDQGTVDFLVVFPFMAAWGIREEYFEEISGKYKLEFRIYVVEQGIGYYEEASFKDWKTVSVVSGPKYEGNDGYGQFVWECPFPFLGG